MFLCDLVTSLFVLQGFGSLNLGFDTVECFFFFFYSFLFSFFFFLSPFLSVSASHFLRPFGFLGHFHGGRSGDKRQDNTRECLVITLSPCSQGVEPQCLGYVASHPNLTNQTNYLSVLVDLQQLESNKKINEE